MHKDEIHCTLKHYRQRKGLSQEELGNMVGLRRQAVYDMESGKYLPNTGVALQLAKALGCTVEMLFAQGEPAKTTPVHLPTDQNINSGRLALAKINDKVVGVPLQGPMSMNFQLSRADGLLTAANQAELLFPESKLEKNILIWGCDPALSLLEDTIARLAPTMRAHTVFASSRRSLEALGAQKAHIAATHFHSYGKAKANIEAVKNMLPDTPTLMLGFSLQEEGLMVGRGNPLGIAGVADLPRKGIKFVNRETGAALRKLLDSLLADTGISPENIQGYTDEVHSHCDGAFRVANGMAHAALGLRVVSEAFGLDFIPLATTQCDLVIPAELCSHPGVAIMLDLLQSARVKNELNAIPGYDASALGNIVLRPKKTKRAKNIDAEKS